MVDISDGIQFRRDGVDPSQWPILSCSQANQVALEVGDLRLDANREIFLQGNGQLRSFDDMLFLTGDPSLEKLRILANGNIGIGKPDPGAKLEVNGNLKLQLGVAVNKFSSDGNLTDNSDLSVPTEKAVRTYVNAQIAVVNQALSTKAALAGASSQDFQTKNLTVSGNLATTGNVSIGTTTTPANLEVNGTVKATAFQGNGATLDGIVKKTGDTMTGALTINNALTVSGNVGIGITTPSTKLDVNGTVKATSFQGNGANLDGIVRKAGDTISGALTVQNSLTVSGNIGIGTTNPNHKFHVLAADAVGLLESTGNQAYLRLSTNEGLDNRVEITNRPGGRLSLWTAGNGDVFNITRTGNVGIGTTAPAAKLDVEGNAMLGYEGNISNFGAPLKSGFYQNNGGQEIPGDIPDTSHNWTHLIVARHSNTQNNHQLQIASSYTNNDRLFFRKIQQGGLTTDNPSWNEVATKAYVDQKINEIWSRFNTHVHRWGATNTTYPL